MCVLGDFGPKKYNSYLKTSIKNNNINNNGEFKDQNGFGKRDELGTQSKLICLT